MVAQETEPRERESLIFDTPEKAQDFVERVEEKVQQDKRQGIERKREITAQEIATEIEQYGEESIDLTQPWEHSPEEHQEVQSLVEVAFREDLPLALKKARKSKDYPRIIDLFHDVLTGQMYEAVVQAGVNKQKVGKGQWVIVAGVLLLIITALIIFLFS
jgi:hypothetical protein